MNEPEHEDHTEPRYEAQAADQPDAVAPTDFEPMDHVDPSEAPVGDVDARGHLATGLFVGVIAVLLVVIYAFSMAA